MTVTISSEDPRSIKAISIAAGASQWLKCHLKDGGKCYGIPSSRSRGVFHLANCETCSCWDFRHHREACKHVLAVRLHCELVKAQQARKAPKLRARRGSATKAVRGAPGSRTSAQKRR